MRIGFLVPTSMEARTIHPLNKHLTCAGYGCGKTAACSAAADLIFNKHCDTILIWGAAGAISNRVHVNDIVVGARTAYRDFNIYPLCGSTGVGWVEDFAENVFFELDPALRKMLISQLRKVFPGRNVLEGTICSGDEFVEMKEGYVRNRVEQESDAVDMESAAVAHFCHILDKKIKVGIIRVISDNADGNAGIDFSEFLDTFAQMSEKMYLFRSNMLEEEDDSARLLAAVRDVPDFPVKGIHFKDMEGVFRDPELLSAACHKLYDLFHIRNKDCRIDKIAGIEPDGLILGFQLAGMFGVPFVPLRKMGALPGETVSCTYTAAGSKCTLTAQKTAFRTGESVLLADDLVATGATLLAARDVIRQCGGACDHCLALGEICSMNGMEALKEHGLSCVSLFRM